MDGAWLARWPMDAARLFSRLSVMFENGSGEGVNSGARCRFPPLCAIRATAAPSSVARRVWCSGEVGWVAR